MKMHSTHEAWKRIGSDIPGYSFVFVLSLLKLKLKKTLFRQVREEKKELVDRENFFGKECVLSMSIKESLNQVLTNKITQK